MLLHLGVRRLWKDRVLLCLVAHEEGRGQFPITVSDSNEIVMS